jgi:hypothetical protein
MLWGVPSPAANNFDNAVEVLFWELSLAANCADEGSSTSFSETCKARRRMGTGTDGRSLDLDVFLLLGPVVVADKAASGLELLEGPAELNDACAVFAEIDAVGGPEENIDLEGVVKSVDCGVVSPLLEGTGRWLPDAAICC